MNKQTAKLFAIVALFATVLFASCKKETSEASPVASFTVSNDSIRENDSIIISNTSTNADTYLWNFGDGTTSTLENPTKSYSDSYREVCEDNFTITLTATKNGKSATATKNIAVEFCP